MSWTELSGNTSVKIYELSWIELTDIFYGVWIGLSEVEIFLQWIQLS